MWHIKMLIRHHDYCTGEPQAAHNKRPLENVWSPSTMSPPVGMLTAGMPSPMAYQRIQRICTDDCRPGESTLPRTSTSSLLTSKMVCATKEFLHRAPEAMSEMLIWRFITRCGQVFYPRCSPDRAEADSVWRHVGEQYVVAHGGATVMVYTGRCMV